MPLVKQSDGSFELTVPLGKDEKFLYKYVVDGEWLVNKSEKLGHDDSGIENNILEAKDLVSAKGASSKIPEAGGLAVASGTAASDLKTTVLPSSEGQQTTLGEPGIHIPKDPEALKAFETVRDVDPKTLNEAEAAAPALTPEEKKKQKKKLKRSQYKAKKKQQRANASSTPEPSPTPEAETLDPAVVGAVGAAGLAGAVGAGAVGATVSAGAGALLAGSVAADIASGSKDVETPTGSETIPGSAAELTESAPTTESAPVTEAAEEATKTTNVDVPTEEKAPEVEAVPETKEVEAAPAVAAVPATLDPKAETKDVEPTVDEPTVEEPTVTEPVAEPVVDESVTETVPESKEVVPETTEAVPETTPVVAQAEPATIQAKEVDAAPVSKHKPTYDSDDEIIIAQGGLSAKEVEAQLAASDINVEEINPTASEAERLAKEAHIPESQAAAKTTKSPTKPAAKTATKTGKKEEKKKGGFLSKLKKLFK